MQHQNDVRPVSTSEAIIRRVDPVGRELTAQAGRALAIYYVPPNCDVRLRGETVKLRMIQPGDRVRMVYTSGSDALIAQSIEVLPAFENTFSSPSSSRVR